jgi:hypothetical protein
MKVPSRAIARMENLIWWVAEVGVSVMLILYSVITAAYALKLPLNAAFARVVSECELLILSTVLIVSTCLYCFRHIAAHIHEFEAEFESATVFAITGVLAIVVLALTYAIIKHEALSDGLTATNALDPAHVTSMCWVSLVVVIVAAASIAFCAAARNNVNLAMIKTKQPPQSPQPPTIRAHH